MERLEESFWERFEERFGRTGRPPRDYWDVRIAHVAHIGPDSVGQLKPTDLLLAADLFDHLYPTE